MRKWKEARVGKKEAVGGRKGELTEKRRKGERPGREGSSLEWAWEEERLNG